MAKLRILKYMTKIKPHFCIASINGKLSLLTESLTWIFYIYTLFGGFALFCEVRSVFPSPPGAKKNTNIEQNVPSYYMLNHRIRGLLFHYKKIKLLFCNWLLFFVKSIQKHPDSVCENDSSIINKMFARVICQTIE